MEEEKKLIATDFSKAEIETCLKVLKSFAEESAQLTLLTEEERVQLLVSSGQLSRPNRQEIRKRQKDVKKLRRQVTREANRKVRKLAGIRTAREASIFASPKQIESSCEETSEQEYATPHSCYVCKASFTKIHFFYDSMCTECAELNYLKRYQNADLSGQVAVVTGSRLKIGYHITLMLLKAGAEVLATTRFPIDSASRYSLEPDFAEWGHRLHIYGLDLRHTPSVELFAKFVEKTFSRLDILINNAAQTVRRPSGFYAHLMEKERFMYSELSTEVQLCLKLHQNCIQELDQHNSDNKNLPISWNAKVLGVGIKASAELSQIPYAIDNNHNPETLFPVGRLDADLQQVDLRKTNSWRLKLGQIPITEMIEVQLVNAIAPFVLVNHLVGLMRKDFTGTKQIINVTAMEGKFHRFKKADRHPHTNMAKAALNMMTHTSAADFAKDGIYTNAVDTGWVTDEDPAELSQKKQELHDFQPPLDIVDGAARVLDPLFDGIKTGKFWSGKFLKDYFPIDW
ncbi:MAG: SDR family oxidoreductase [Halobacteriovoraceae bacterium]|jgi:NAD(P)-dependent dehydrogenase (short-subunit alcohol dehydrogenase family)|nr:SDR family oxidoreductase [Halobacteriovoraceae bacterium]MBT5093405.1 SDR family oxidoreductase [Halobacteriovoraceae bacterium]